MIYRTRNYSLTADDEIVNDDNSGIWRIFFPPKKNNFIYYIFLESDEKPSKVELCTPNIAKIRMLCANGIWRKWSNEKHWGPRVGVILVSTMEEGAEKVCFFCQTIEIQKSLTYFLGFTCFIY